MGVIVGIYLATEKLSWFEAKFTKSLFSINIKGIFLLIAGKWE